MLKLLKQTIGFLFMLILLVLACSSYLQQVKGGVFASRYIYHTAWFFTVWLLLAVCSVVYIIYKKMYHKLSLLALHLSFVLILIGASITFFTSKNGTIVLQAHVPEQFYVDGETGETVQLPFALTLRGTKIKYLMGTHTAIDIESQISCKHLLTNKSADATVSTNSILCIAGYRFYQSLSVSSPQQSILIVNDDFWGTTITYMGYALLCLAMLWILCSKRSLYRKLLHSAVLRRGRGILFFLFLPTFYYSSAATLTHITHAQAHQQARKQVMYNGRIAPLNTVATYFLETIYEAPSYNGLCAEQVLCGWLQQPKVWQQQRMIKINNKQLCKLLGVKGKYASLEQLFNADKTYKLSFLLSQKQIPYNMAAAVIELDNKIKLIEKLTHKTLFSELSPRSYPLSTNRVEAEIVYNRLATTNIPIVLLFLLGVFSFVIWWCGMVNSAAIFGKGIKQWWRIVMVCFALLFIFMLFLYVLRWYISERIPISNTYETIQILLLFMMLLTIFLQRHFRFMLPLGIILSGLILSITRIGHMSAQILPLTTALRSPLLYVHVGVAMLSYALFAIMAMQGLLGLCLGVSKQNKKTVLVIQQLYILNKLLLYPALFLLTFAILLGAVWANISWGRYWGWDQKEIWALITLMVYAIPMHHKSVACLQRPFFFQIYTVLAFFTILITYFGVNYFLESMHASYQ